MRPKPLPAVIFAVARERQIDRLLERTVESLRAQDDVALARVWLAAVDGGCTICPVPEVEPSLHLVASAGTPSHPHEQWTRLDGSFHRVPLGAGKIGKVAASGTGLLLHDMSARSSWIVRPDWAARESIRSFAAHALSFDGEILGVVAVFSRSRIDAAAFGWLRAFSDHAGLALANARGVADSARRAARLEAENACLREETRAALGGDLVAASPAGRKVLEQVDLAASSDGSVLVIGEPGTGKELVARRIHERSPRAAGPFLKVECAAVPHNRLASVLFGREPAGDAIGGRPGRLEAAAGGTLFLEDVDALPLGVQRTLLGVLESRSRVGADARIVAATTRDLRAEVAAGRFLGELQLRLSVLPIAVPPLRERADDVRPLVEHLLDEVSRRRGRPRPTVTTRDLSALERYPWPGNARELADAVERAVMTATDGRARFDLIAWRSGADDVIPALDFRRRERANLEAALARTAGRIYGPGGAAELLGLPPTTLTSRVKALGVARRPGRSEP